jgi:hypothetical protein
MAGGLNAENQVSMGTYGVINFTLGISKKDLLGTLRPVRDAVSKAREFLSEGVWQVGLSGTASAGIIGLSLGTGLIIDFKEGLNIELYFSLEHAIGADLSFGRVLNYYKPTHGTLKASNLKGWGESYNLGIGAWDFSYGGDSFWTGLKNLLKFSDTHPTYRSYGFGYSPTGLPLGFTHRKGYTWVTGK